MSKSFQVGDRVEHGSGLKIVVTAINENGLSGVGERGSEAGGPFRDWRHVPIDWGAPLEAYHVDGRVIEIEWARDMGGHVKIGPTLPRDEGLPAHHTCHYSFNHDGTHAVAKWRIRNRITPALTSMDAPVCCGCGVSPDLVDRMVEAVRELAGDDYRYNFGPVWGEIRAINACLPEPVDPLLVVKAREICAAECRGGPDERYYLSGERDASMQMRVALAALREDVS